MVKIAGITRIRNEEDIIDETLEHYEKFCNHGIYIYDDCSNDNTVNICSSHESVKKIVHGEKWDQDRTRAEYTTRQIILEEAQKDNPDWILYFDADERIDCNWEQMSYFFRSPDIFAIHMQLFDAYITTDDFSGYPFNDNKIKHYSNRKWFGPEFREIGMFFKNTPHLKYHLRDQRIATYRGQGIIFGKVKHYGKAISIKQWEETCDYYIKNFPEPYKTKWKERKGKAIHDKSDFGRDLIIWDETDKKGILLNE